MKNFFWTILLISLNLQAASLPPLPGALQAMESDAAIAVEQHKEASWRTVKHYYSFDSTKNRKSIGVIFYPGGRVDPRGYAPILRQIAIEGYKTFLVPMPFDIAKFGQMRANEIIKNHPSIKNWVIGGHSLGGVSASHFTKKESSKIDGLFLWASYPSRFNNLSKVKTNVFSLYSELDGLTKISDIEKNKKYLPNETVYQMIVGGNHSWFGSYGDGKPQQGDNPADISREEQQKFVRDEMIRWLESL